MTPYAPISYGRDAGRLGAHRWENMRSRPSIPSSKETGAFCLVQMYRTDNLVRIGMKKASSKPVIIIATIAAFSALIIVLASCARSGTSPQSTSTVPTCNGQAELSIAPEPQETSEISEPPIIPGSELSLNVIDESTGLPVSNVTFIISIEYDPPLDGNNFSYTLFAAGESPYRIPITVPGSPSRAVITATKEGFLVSAELVIESEFYHERINRFREGVVGEFLLVHTFTIRPVETTETQP